MTIRVALPYPALLVSPKSFTARALSLTHLFLAMGGTLVLFGIPPVTGLVLAAITLIAAQIRATVQWERTLALSWQRLMLYVLLLLSGLLFSTGTPNIWWLFPLLLTPLSLADAYHIAHLKPLFGDRGHGNA